MVNIFRRAKHFEIQTWPPLAPNVDRVPLIEIDSPGRSFRFPAETIKFHCEPGRCALRIVRSQALYGRRVAICDRHHPRLSWAQINLKSKFVILVVAVKIVRLRWKLDRLQSACVFFKRGRIARGYDCVPRFEIGSDTL